MEQLGKKQEGKVAEFDQRKTEKELEEDEMQKYRGGSLMGSMRDDTMNDGTAANLEEEPAQSDIAEDDLTEQIDIEDEIL